MSLNGNKTSPLPSGRHCAPNTSVRRILVSLTVRQKSFPHLPDPLRWADHLSQATFTEADDPWILFIAVTETLEELFTVNPKRGAREQSG